MLTNREITIIETTANAIIYADCDGVIRKAAIYRKPNGRACVKVYLNGHRVSMHAARLVAVVASGLTFAEAATMDAHHSICGTREKWGVSDTRLIEHDVHMAMHKQGRW